MTAATTRRIDPYVQHLLRHQALGLTLESDQPVSFRFQQGERSANTSLDHATVTQIVNEAAPRSALEELSRAGRASFPYQGPSGSRILVEVEARSATRWRVSIAPAPEDDDQGLELDLGSAGNATSVGHGRPGTRGRAARTRAADADVVARGGAPAAPSPPAPAVRR